MVLATQSFTVLFHPFVTDVEVPAAFVPSHGDTAVLQWADPQFGAAVRIGLSLCSSDKVSCVAANLWCRFIVRHRAAACHSDTQHGAKSCALLQASLLSENRGIVPQITLRAWGPPCLLTNPWLFFPVARATDT